MKTSSMCGLLPWSLLSPNLGCCLPSDPLPLKCTPLVPPASPGVRGELGGDDFLPPPTSRKGSQRKRRRQQQVRGSSAGRGGGGGSSGADAAAATPREDDGLLDERSSSFLLSTFPLLTFPSPLPQQKEASCCSESTSSWSERESRGTGEMEGEKKGGCVE